MILLKRHRIRHFNTDVRIEVILNYPKGDQSYKRIGTVYELYAQSALQRFGISSEIRGSAGDGGVDLRGTWCLGNEKDIDGTNKQKTLNVIGQCKRMSKPLSPNYVRELEGTFQHCTAMQDDKEYVAIMISRTAPSKQALERIRISQVPITFIRLIDTFEDFDYSEEIFSSIPHDKYSTYIQNAISHNNGLLHALTNQAMQNKYPKVSVVMKRSRIDDKIMYLPTLVYNGVIIPSLFNK